MGRPRIWPRELSPRDRRRLVDIARYVLDAVEPAQRLKQLDLFARARGIIVDVRTARLALRKASA